MTYEIVRGYYGYGYAVRDANGEYFRTSIDDMLMITKITTFWTLWGAKREIDRIAQLRAPGIPWRPQVLEIVER